MSWGTELWDQYDNLAKHTEKGIEFCEKYVHFLKERCAIEAEYAGKLKKLHKNAQPKKREEDDYQFSHTQSFLTMTKEVYDLAGQHEVIAETLNSSVIKDMQTLISELKVERRKYLAEYLECERKLAKQIGVLDNSKKQYEKAFREAERAQEAYKKADADIYLSRAEVEKAKNISMQKNKLCDDSKSEYACQLQKSNDDQREHYNTLIPKTLQSLQDMDEKRICQIQEFMKSSADIERKVSPIINTCVDGMTRASEAIDASADSKLVIEKYKSGFQPPADIPFEDLSDSASIGDTNSSTPVSGSNSKHDTAKGTITGKTKKKKGGLFNLFSGKPTAEENKEDFSNLAPNQQRKQLVKKIEAIRAEIKKETDSRDAMVKMRDVYTNNPNMGDPASIDKQLEDNAQKLDRLRGEEQKFEVFLSEVDHREGTPKTNRKAMHGSRSSLVTDSPVSQSSSEVNLQQSSSNPSLTGTPGQSRQSDNRLSSARQSEYRLSSSRQSDYRLSTASQSALLSVGSHSTISENNVEESSPANFTTQESFDAIDDEFVLGRCRALYPFPGTNEGSISMEQDEYFSLIEQDQGDGWTRVRRNNGEEGYVPTAWLDIELY